MKKKSLIIMECLFIIANYTMLKDEISIKYQITLIYITFYRVIILYIIILLGYIHSSKKNKHSTNNIESTFYSGFSETLKIKNCLFKRVFYKVPPKVVKPLLMYPHYKLLNQGVQRMFFKYLIL
jgi:hypothetical protein